MAITAASIIQQAQIQLNDVAGTRWPASELVDHLNDGLLELVDLRPDATATTASVTLEEGVRQAVPSNCQKLMDIPRNTNGPGIRKIMRQTMDLFNSDWYQDPESSTILHFMHDEREPLVFEVYPPATATGAAVDMMYSAAPTPIATPSGTDYTTVVGDIDVQDTYKTPLVAYVLYKAWTKDGEFGANMAMGTAQYELFKSLLSSDVESRSAVKPTVGGNTGASA